MAAATSGRRVVSVRFWAMVAVSLMVAVLLGRAAFKVNLDKACESRQWPVEAGCRLAPLPGGQDPANEEWRRLKKRLTNNPGDGLVVADMARYAGVPSTQTGVDGDRLLDQAVQLAPHRDEVLKQLVVRALARQDWAQAVPPLVQLAERRGDPEAARALARLMVLSSQDAALLDVLHRASRERTDWVDRALRMIAPEKLPMWATLPFLGDLLQRNAIRQATGLAVVRQLKSEDRWLDAHAVWLQLWRRPLDLVHNGDFEREFVPDTFDWDTAAGGAARSGVELDRIGAGARGRVLRLRWTGRPFATPPLKHDLFLPSGTYRFEGDFRAIDKDLGQRLFWSVTCHAGGGELARSTALAASGQDWDRVAFEFKVGNDCQALTLALVPASRTESAQGMKGEIDLDRIVLMRHMNAGNGEPR